MVACSVNTMNRTPGLQKQPLMKMLFCCNDFDPLKVKIVASDIYMLRDLRVGKFTRNCTFVFICSGLLLRISLFVHSTQNCNLYSSLCIPHWSLNSYHVDLSDVENIGQSFYGAMGNLDVVCFQSTL